VASGELSYLIAVPPFVGTRAGIWANRYDDVGEGEPFRLQPPVPWNRIAGDGHEPRPHRRRV